ncbi:MAG: HEPN domain-containing protein [Bacteroidales bacterium]|nr:HEPN domain-containing protein [Bacteroidales bacterium]
MRRYKDWLRQAKRKLESAKWDLKGNFYEDACFSSQQAAELAAKALLEKKGRTEIGHSIFFLLSKLPDIPKELLDEAKILDRYYIPTRYPNGFANGAPMDYFEEKTAKEAIDFAQNIIRFIAKEIG